MFQIIFYKTLMDSSGHAHRTTQGVIRVTEIVTRDAALEIAKCRIAEQRRYCRWEYCADEVAIEEFTG